MNADGTDGRGSNPRPSVQSVKIRVPFFAMVHAPLEIAAVNAGISLRAGIWIIRTVFLSTRVRGQKQQLFFEIFWPRASLGGA
jgi:hypothetical protein